MPNMNLSVWVVVVLVTMSGCSQDRGMASNPRSTTSIRCLVQPLPEVGVQQAMEQMLARFAPD